MITDTVGREHEVEIRFTEYAGHGAEIADEIKSEFDAIVAIGGDGTVNEIASQLVDSNCALGVVPSGSGNGLARHLKIPLNLKSALERIATFNVESYDTGEVNGHFFIGTCGFGFDGYIAHLFDQYHKRGFISYAKLIAKEYQHYEPKKYVIKIGDETYEHTALVCAVANSSQFGNGFYISPNSDMTDGKMEITVIDKFPLIDSAAIGARFFTQTIDNSKYFRSYSFSDTVQIQVDEKVNFHVDGEPHSEQETFDISIKADSIKIL